MFDIAFFALLRWETTVMMFQPTLAVINKKKLGLPKSLTGLLCEGVCGVCVAHGGHLKIPKEVSLFSLFSKRHLKYQRQVLTASDDAAKKSSGGLVSLVPDAALKILSGTVAKHPRSFPVGRFR